MINRTILNPPWSSSQSSARGLHGPEVRMHRAQATARRDLGWPELRRPSVSHLYVQDSVEKVVLQKDIDIKKPHYHLLLGYSKSILIYHIHILSLKFIVRYPSISSISIYMHLLPSISIDIIYIHLYPFISSISIYFITIHLYPSISIYPCMSSISI